MNRLSNRLVNKVAKECDADSDYNEVVAIAESFGANEETADLVAKELGRRPSAKICSICKDPYYGFGNNAQPINNSRCCDVCNTVHVIPARIARIYKDFEVKKPRRAK